TVESRARNKLRFMRSRILPPPLNEPQAYGMAKKRGKMESLAVTPLETKVKKHGNDQRSQSPIREDESASVRGTVRQYWGGEHGKNEDSHTFITKRLLHFFQVSRRFVRFSSSARG